MWCSELKGNRDDESEGDDRHHDDSEAESDHVTQEPEEGDIVMRGGAESPPVPHDNESDIGSTVSNPLEDSDYVHRCKASSICSSTWLACTVNVLYNT